MMKRTTKTRIKEKIVNITVDLLEHFYNAGGNILAGSISRKEAYRIFNSNYYGSHTEVPFAKWLYRLRDQGYVKYTPKSESIEFTFKTRLRLMKQIGKKIEESTSYHFLSFDIPETLRKSRDTFRKAIKDLGYIQVQKSLWVINKDVFYVVQQIAYEIGIEKYVANIISAQSDIDGVLDKKFTNIARS